MKKGNKKNEGFVILFAVAVSSILLAIALGVANIALKEIKFGTSAKETNVSFLAADTGAECAMYNDKGLASFPVAGPASAITCNGQTIPTSYSSYAGGQGGFYTFKLLDLTDQSSCASVIVDKSIVGSDVKTSIISNGYNRGSGACDGAGSERIERQLKISYFEKNPIPPSPLSFGVIPGTIQAEDYDTGGEGVGYHDTTSGNTGGVYRTDDVDIQTTTDPMGGGYHVGWVAAGEWLRYTVNVATTGTYKVTFRVANWNTTRTVHLLDTDGTDLATVSIPQTGTNYDDWNNVTTVVDLTAGTHELKFKTDSSLFNFNYMKFEPYVPTPPSYRTFASAVVNTSSSSVRLSVPNGTAQVGDVLVASIAVRPYNANITAPSGVGWNGTGMTSSNNAGNSIRIGTYVKVATASDFDASGNLRASSFAIGGGYTFAVGGMIVVSGANTLDPIIKFDGQSTSTLSSRTPTVSSMVRDTFVITSHAVSSAASWAPPTGMTEALEKAGGFTVPNTDGISLEMNYGTQSSIANIYKIATQQQSGGVPAADSGIAQIIIVQP